MMPCAFCHSEGQDLAGRPFCTACLPTMLAVPWEELRNEYHPVVRLWRLCDEVELTLRLFTAIATAQLQGKIPDDAARSLVTLVERPTLFHWLLAAETLSRVPVAAPLVPELPGAVELFAELLRNPRGQAPAMLSLRNQLAHGAGFSQQAAIELFEPTLDRLLEAFQQLGFLREALFVAKDHRGEPWLLRGPAPTPGAGGVPCELLASLELEQVGVVRGGQLLPLWPLHAYLPPRLWRPGGDEETQGQNPAPGVYARKEGKRLELTLLGAEVPVAELRGQAVAAFDALFRLREKEALLGHSFQDFEEEFRLEAQALVGRESIVADILARLEGASEGVFWLQGHPGVGKSALVAKLFTELAQRLSGAGCNLVLGWRFRAGDPRASRAKFLAYVVERLEKWKPLGASSTELAEDPHVDPRVLESQMGKLLSKIQPPLRVVCFLDALDEGLRGDPGLAELPFRHKGVVWVCAGRPEPPLLAAFDPSRCTHLFGSEGLPPLTAEEVSAWLKRDAPPSERDAIVRGEQEGRVMRWVETVAQRSQGLPAYIQLLLDDLRTRAIVVGQTVPQGLAAYFDRLLERAGVDDPAAVLPYLMAAVALAVEAPTLATLEEVLRRAGVLAEATREQHRQILEIAVARARVMLRQLGEDRWVPYHDELTKHLATAPQLANARAKALDGWRALALDPGSAAEEQARRHGFATGVRQLLQLGCRAEAEALLGNFAYHASRLEQLGGQGVTGLLEDFALLASPELVPWRRFFRDNAHRLRRAEPGEPALVALLQLAYAYGEESVPSRAAEAWLAEGHATPLWLRRRNRPKQAYESPCILTIEGHGLWVSALALHPDGRRLVSGSGDSTIKVWDLETGACLRTLEEHLAAVLALALHPDRRRVVSGSRDTTIKVWDLETGECLRTLAGDSGAVSALVLHPDGRRVVSGTEDNAIKVWDLETGGCLRTLEEDSASVTGLAPRADGSRVESRSFSKTNKAWELQMEAFFRPLDRYLNEYPKGVWALALHPDGRRLVSGKWDGTITVFDLETGERLRTLEAHEGCIRAIALHPDRQWVVSGGNDNTIKVWDVRTGALVRELVLDRWRVRALALDPAGNVLASGSDYKSIEIWDLETGNCVRTLNGQSWGINALALDHDGRRLVSGDDDGTIKLWDLKTTYRFHELAAHPEGVHALALCPNSLRLVSAGKFGTIKVWDLATGSCVCTLEGHRWAVTALAFDPDGGRLVSGSGDQTIKIWDLKSGACLRTLEGHSHWVMAVALHPDGSRLASGDDFGVIKVWDPETGACLRSLEGHSGWVTALAFHLDGQRLVSGGGDGAIKVWDLETGACERTVKAHWASVRAAALDADGRRLVSVGQDNTMSISDLVTGVCLYGIIEELSHDVTALALGPGARQLVSGGEDKVLELWDLKTGRCLATWDDDAEITCAAVSERFVAAGTSAGDVVILEIVPPSPPLRL